MCREGRSGVDLTCPHGNSRDFQHGPLPAHLAQCCHVLGGTWSGQGTGCQAHRPGSTAVSLTWAGPWASSLNSPAAEPTEGDPGLRQEVSEMKGVNTYISTDPVSPGPTRLAWGKLGVQSGPLALQEMSRFSQQFIIL